jgi:quercetin dioxygenase-like cupin family protein
MFTKNTNSKFRILMKGVSMRPLAFGEKTNLCQFRLQKNHKLPSHSHPYEQTGFLLSGKLNFRIDTEWFAVEAGDSWSIPVNTEHEVEVLENSVVLEVFSPVRPDYLPD